MELISSITISIFLFSIFLCSSILRKNRKQHLDKAKLPPGSMGWPYIGETLQFYSQNPNVFFATKQQRYGEIFKTHLLGCPSVMLASPEAARFVLVTQAHLFKPTYPKSKEKMIGPSAIFFHQGDYHTRLRKLVQGSLSLEFIRNLVPHIQAIALNTLNSLDGGRVFNTFHEMKKYSFDVGILSIFGRLDASYQEELKKNYCTVDIGYNSFPTKMPGTTYHNALLARKRLSKILSKIVSERREKRVVEKDLLDCLMNSKDEKGVPLSDDQIADNVIGVLFAAQDTTASVLTWIFKYLYENTKLLQAVRAEHMAIHESNARENQTLTWAQTRNMPLTSKVIMESLRMASIISFTFREAVADVEYKEPPCRRVKLLAVVISLIQNGVYLFAAENTPISNFYQIPSYNQFICWYLIPKGWKVMPLFRNIHHSPEFFPDPQKFDPSRFEVAPKPNTFYPFGSGVHACPGNELAKLEMHVLIHYLVTKFRWEVVRFQSGIQYSPFPVPLKGLPSRFWKLSGSSTSTATRKKVE